MNENSGLIFNKQTGNILIQLIGKDRTTSEWGWENILKHIEFGEDGWDGDVNSPAAVKFDRTLFMFVPESSLLWESTSRETLLIAYCILIKYELDHECKYYDSQ